MTVILSLSLITSIAKSSYHFYVGVMLELEINCSVCMLLPFFGRNNIWWTYGLLEWLLSLFFQFCCKVENIFFLCTFVAFFHLAYILFGSLHFSES